jgi:hypothetical protein
VTGPSNELSGRNARCDTRSPFFQALPKKALEPRLPSVEIENIEEMRRQAGILDVELETEIQALDVGDCVRVTLLSRVKPFGAETLIVEITKIRGSTYLGRLAQGPTTAGLAQLSAGSTLSFARAHIHSIAKRRSAPD